MPVIFASYLSSPLGEIEIAANENAIESIGFLEGPKSNYPCQENEISKIAQQQLLEYIENKRITFDLPLAFLGSDFQNKVWRQLQTIPFGKTMSYLQFAIDLGNEKCIRAAASANGKNPFAIVVPCHRVIGKNGALIGYAGGLWRKQWLLEHEGAFSKQNILFAESNTR